MRTILVLLLHGVSTNSYCFGLGLHKPRTQSGNSKQITSVEARRENKQKKGRTKTGKWTVGVLRTYLTHACHIKVLYRPTPRCHLFGERMRNAHDVERVPDSARYD
jgi:hypothetical protein